MDFTDARHIARMSRQEIANYLDISPRTIKRYEETGKAPRAIIECLLMIGGRMPTFSRRNDFTGWFFGSGFLYSPNGDRFTSGDILALRTDRALIRELVRNNNDLKKRASMSVPSNVIPFPAIHRDNRVLA